MSVTSSNLSTSLDELSYSDLSETVSKQRGSSELGKQEFMKLLTTQMQYQDPLNPQSDQDFIAQLAQFSSLEQMQNLNSTFNNTSAYSLIDKYVEIEHSEANGESKSAEGIVESVKINKEGAQVVVDGQSFSVDDIYKVSTPTEEQLAELLKKRDAEKAKTEEDNKKNTSTTNTQSGGSTSQKTEETAAAQTDDGVTKEAEEAAGTEEAEKEATEG